MVSVNTLCKSVLNVKNTVIENCNLYSDEDGVKHIRIKARPNKWHENDCPFCHKSCPVYDKHSSRPTTWRGLDWGGILVEIEYQTHMLNNLKKWMRNLIILSSCGMGIAYWAIKIQEGLMFHIVGGISIFLATICVIGCAVIGLALKRGQENVNKIVRIIQN